MNNGHLEILIVTAGYAILRRNSDYPPGLTKFEVNQLFLMSYVFDSQKSINSTGIIQMYLTHRVCPKQNYPMVSTN